MYLVKYALLAKGEQIHIANFPGSPLKPMTGFNGAIDLILRCSSTLGQIFILNAINFVSEEMMEKIFNTDAKKEFYADTNNGGASIIAPRGTYLAEPVLNKEMIVIISYHSHPCPAHQFNYTTNPPHKLNPFTKHTL